MRARAEARRRQWKGSSSGAGTDRRRHRTDLFELRKATEPAAAPQHVRQLECSQEGRATATAASHIEAHSSRFAFFSSPFVRFVSCFFCDGRWSRVESSASPHYRLLITRSVYHLNNSYSYKYISGTNRSQSMNKPMPTSMNQPTSAALNYSYSSMQREMHTHTHTVLYTLLVYYSSLYCTCCLCDTCQVLPVPVRRQPSRR